MLKLMRKNTKAIVWTVIVSFALWGAYSVSTGLMKGNRFAGEIFGKGIPFQEYDQFYKAGQIFSFSEKPIDDPELLKQQTWQNVIYSHEAKRLRIEVSDNEVRAEIKRLMDIKENETLSPALYQRWLIDVVKEPAVNFEKQVRELLRIQKLILRIYDHGFTPATPEDAKQAYLMETQKIDLESARFPDLQSALNFAAGIKSSKNWNDAVSKNPALQVEKTNGLVPAKSVLARWQISKDDALILLNAEPGKVFQPLKSGGLYTVFFVLSKTDADKTQFTKTMESEYLEKLTKEKKYQRFLEWNMDLLMKANLKDYLPRSESADLPNS